MRRGLMKWLPQEMPVAVLEARLARLQAAMQAAGLDAMLAYTSFAQPAAVHWLTHFTPYWSEAVLVVPAQGRPVLLAALTPRVHAWIREVSHVGDLISAPKLGPAAVDWLADHAAPGARLGVISLDTLPWSVGQALMAAYPGPRLVDAAALFREVRHLPDAAERALALHADQIALDALRAVPADARQASGLAAVAEMSARQAGAEELLQRVAPDLRQGAALRRLEGDFELADHYAVELSAAYKGVWVREGRSVSRSPAPAHWTACEAWFDSLVADPTALPALRRGAMAAPGGGVLAWSLEAGTGLQPLTVIASNACGGLAPVAALPSGTVCVLSATIDSQAGHWFHSATLEVTDNGLRRLVSTATTQGDTP